MAFNLGDLVAGAAGGFGQGMAMNAKSDIDAQQQSDRARQASELDTQRATAMANLQRSLTEPDRAQAQKNFETTATENARYHTGMLDNKTEMARLKGLADDSAAGARMQKADSDAVRAQAAADRANGIGGSGGTGAKAGKLDQTMNDADKIRYEAIIKDTQALKDELDPKIKEQKQQTLIYQKITGFGDPEMTMTPKGEVIFRNRFGDMQKFKDAAAATAAGFGGEKLDSMVAEVNAHMMKQGETAKQQQTMNRSGEQQRVAAEKFAASPAADRSLRSVVDGAEKQQSSLADLIGTKQPAASPQNLNEAIRARSKAASALSAEENAIKKQAYDAAMQQMGGAMTDKNVRAADDAARQAAQSNPKTAALRKTFEEADAYVRSMARM